VAAPAVTLALDGDVDVHEARDRHAEAGEPPRAREVDVLAAQRPLELAARDAERSGQRAEPLAGERHAAHVDAAGDDGDPVEPPLGALVAALDGEADAGERPSRKVGPRRRGDAAPRRVA